MNKTTLISTTEQVKVGEIKLTKSLGLQVTPEGLCVGAKRRIRREVLIDEARRVIEFINAKGKSPRDITSVDIVTSTHPQVNIWVLHATEVKTYNVDNFADAAIAIHEIYK